NIQQNFNPWGIGWDQRARWAEGLGIPTMAEANAAEGIEVLYWVGCAASFDDRNRKVAQAFARILRKAGVRFAILGPEEKCTGDPPRRLGNEYLAQTMIMGNVETLNCYGAGGARMWMEERGEKVNHRRLSHIEETHANAVATACPYCLIMLDDAAKTKNREDIRRYDIAELLDRST